MTRFARELRWLEVHPESAPVTTGTRPVVVAGGSLLGALAAEPLQDVPWVALPDWACIESDECDFYEPHLRRMVHVSFPSPRLLHPLETQ